MPGSNPGHLLTFAHLIYIACLTIVITHQIVAVLLPAHLNGNGALNIAQESLVRILEKCGLDTSVMKWVSERVEYTVEKTLDNS